MAKGYHRRSGYIGSPYPFAKCVFECIVDVFLDSGSVLVWFGLTVAVAVRDLPYVPVKPTHTCQCATG